MRGRKKKKIKNKRFEKAINMPATEKKNFKFKFKFGKKNVVGFFFFFCFTIPLETKKTRSKDQNQNQDQGQGRPSERRVTVSATIDFLFSPKPINQQQIIKKKIKNPT